LSRILPALLLGVALLVFAAANAVRLAADGLDCEPWPACYAQPETALAARETPLARALVAANRIGTAGIGLLAAVLLAWPGIAPSARGSSALVLLFAALAAWTAFVPPPALPWVTMAGVLAMLAVIALALQLLSARPARADADPQASPPDAPRSGRRVLLALLALLVLQVLTGILISTRAAGAACAVACYHLWLPGLPKVFDPWTAGSAIDLLRNTAGGQPLQAIHRLAGMAVALAAIAGALAVVRGRLGLALGVAVTATVLLGLAVAAHDGPVAAVVAHGLAAALAVALLYAALAHRNRSPGRE
jgi:cytochrome c oxidase assembly protein subunit 15